MAQQIDNAFKMAYRKAQKSYPQLKEHWLSLVHEHYKAIEKDVTGYEEAIKHFLGLK